MSAEMETLAASLIWYEKRAILAADQRGLTDKQTARCTLIVRRPLVDYSFRPARFTPLGLSVRDALRARPTTTGEAGEKS